MWGLRGGAYGVEAEDVRCAARAAAAIDYGVAYGGFRVVTNAVTDNVS